MGVDKAVIAKETMTGDKAIIIKIYYWVCNIIDVIYDNNTIKRGKRIELHRRNISISHWN